MAHSKNNTLSSAFKTFFDEWYRSLRIVLRVANTFDYLYKPCPDQPTDTATEADKAAFRAEYKKHSNPPAVEIYDLADALHSCRQPLGLKDKAPTPQVFTIQKGRDNKPKPQANKMVKGKGKADKNKQVVPYQPKPKPNPLKRKENPNED
nr:hypothetical protein [Tanacetum cinerariifolium]